MLSPHPIPTSAPAAPPDSAQHILIPVDTRQEDFVLEAFGPFESVTALSEWKRSYSVQSYFWRVLTLVCPEDYQRQAHYPLRFARLPAGKQVLLMFERDPHPNVRLPHFAIGPFSTDDLWSWIDFGPSQDWRLLKLNAVGL